MTNVNLARRLILGTVQFGLPYGATNQRGQVLFEDARGIIGCARAAGISLVDTASCYGTSEALLGECLFEFRDIGVVTKTAVMTDTIIGPAQIKKMREGISHSLDLLRRSQLDGLLIHSSGDLLKPGGESIIELLMLLKSEGVVKRIGVSVYDAAEIDGVLEIFRPDIVQLPLNIFDQRLIQSGHIKALKSEGIEIHARSAFLQGILLSERSALPEYFKRFDSLDGYSAFLRNNQLTALSACLGFMFQQSGVDRVIVGVTAKSELEEILTALPEAALPSMQHLGSEETELIDPRTWPVLRPVTEAAKS